MELIELNSMYELPSNVLSNINNDNIGLNINFDDIESKKQVNLFLHNNQNIMNYYLMDNYNISIDLLNYDYKIYLWLIDCIQYAYTKINNSTYILLFENTSKWNISICDNIMFNLPFTLSDIIYLPISYLKLCYFTKDTTKFINTLIHEKIHLGQRVKELEWEKFINHNSKNWIKIKSNDVIFHLTEQFINNYSDNNYCLISNPDTFYSNFKYIYFDSNKYYYGQYVFNKKTQHIEKKFFQLNNKKFELVANEFEQEHPYELYAYKIADELVK